MKETDKSVVEKNLYFRARRVKGNEAFSNVHRLLLTLLTSKRV